MIEEISAPMRERGVLFVCADQFGREIVLYEDTWYDHVMIGHGKLAGRIAAVEATITHPNRITRDRTSPNRQCYDRDGELPRSDHDRYIKVVVEFDLHGSDRIEQGVIVTAFTTDEVNPREKRVW